MTIEEIIQMLDNQLSTLRPDFYKSLNRPLTELDINRLEEKYKIRIPSDLRTLYKWKDGQSDKGQLIQFWHSDSDRNVISPTLEAFIGKLTHYYDTKSENDFDKYFRVENIDGYPKKFRVE